MYTICRAMPHHAQELADLDKLCNPSAWTVSHFQAALTQTHNTILCVYQQQKIIAFIVWQKILDEIELHLIATAPHMRRLGIASHLLQKLIQTAQNQNVTRIFLEVRSSNIAAQKLYQQHQFQCIGQRKNYYSNGEDALIYQYNTVG